MRHLSKLNTNGVPGSRPRALLNNPGFDRNCLPEGRVNRLDDVFVDFVNSTLVRFSVIGDGAVTSRDFMEGTPRSNVF